MQSESSSVRGSTTSEYCISASTPPGRSRPAARAQPIWGSIQWNAVAENTPANVPSGRETSSKRPWWKRTAAPSPTRRRASLDHVLAGIDRVDLEALGDECRGEQTGAASDLKTGRLRSDAPRSIAASISSCG